MQSTNGELLAWSPSLFEESPEYEDARAGQCRFAPNCGGVELPSGKVTRPSYPTCPAPAEFAERVGMTEHAGAGQPRYVAICRARAESRFGLSGVAEAEAEAAVQ